MEGSFARRTGEGVWNGLPSLAVRGGTYYVKRTREVHSAAKHPTPSPVRRAKEPSKQYPIPTSGTLKSDL